MSRRRFAPALLATAAALLVALLAPAGARAGDGALADAIRQAFGGEVRGAGATDGQALVWTAATRSWGPGAAGAATPTLAEVLAAGADGNGVDQSNLGSLTLAAGEGIASTSDVTSFSKSVAIKDVTSLPSDPAGYTQLVSYNQSGDVAPYVSVGGVGYRLPAGAFAKWTAITLAVSWTSQTTVTAYMKRDGDDALIRGRISLSGAPTSTDLIVTLPTVNMNGSTSALAIDTTKLATSEAVTGPLGSVLVRDAGAATYPGVAAFLSSTTIYLLKQNASGTDLATNTISATAPITFGSGDSVTFELRIPIQGW